MSNVLTVNNGVVVVDNSAVLAPMPGIVQDTRSYTATSVGSHTITPSTGYDAMEEVDLTVSLPSVSATTYIPGTSNQSIASGQYLSGTQLILGDANLVAGNIKNGVTLFSGTTGAITGTLAPSSWTLVSTNEANNVSTTSGTATSIGTLNIGSSIYTGAKIICVSVRDKAGPRNGYFVGSDTFFFNFYDANSATTTITEAIRYTHRKASNLVYTSYPTSGTTGYGVYAYSITSAGVLTMYRRYSSSYSLTINGSYYIYTYALDYAPNSGNPFNYTAIT